MHVQPFEPWMADDVASWPSDQAECLAWCSAVAVRGDEVVAWTVADDVEAWALVDGERPVAYGEIWVDHEEGEVELAHLIVVPDRRSTGVGRSLVAVLAARGAEHHDLLVMRVRPDNAAAVRCYGAAGFERVPGDEEAEWNVGQPVAYIWMSRRAGR